MKVSFRIGTGADEIKFSRSNTGIMTMDIPTINDIHITLEDYESLIEQKNCERVVGIVVNKQNSD